MSAARRRVVDIELRDFELGGVSLEGATKERYNDMQQELKKLSTKFSNNVLDATKVGGTSNSNSTVQGISLRGGSEFFGFARGVKTITIREGKAPVR
jgi:Zn-dependent oligopeptidase